MTCGRPAPRSTPPTALAGDDARLADLTRWYGGFVLIQEGRPPRRWPTWSAAARPSPHAGRPGTRAAACCSRRSRTSRLGDTAAGRAACEDAIRIIEPLGDAWGLLHAEAALGRVAQAEHRFADAARHHAHAAESAGRLGFPGRAALHLSHLGRGPARRAATPPRPHTLRRAIAGAEHAGDLRLLAVDPRGTGPGAPVRR